MKDNKLIVVYILDIKLFSTYLVSVANVLRKVATYALFLVMPFQHIIKFSRNLISVNFCQNPKIVAK